MNFVADTVEGFLRAGSAPGAEGLTVNVGSGRGVSMKELLEMAMAVTGNSPRVETEESRVRPEHSEVMELVCDATLARDVLGWESRTPLEEGVRQTVAWMQEHLAQYKPHLYNV
jgi:nucleoside-diphosphate-sugar epimerase